jgi:hypothetical protein
MNGLRVYINSIVPDSRSDAAVFYSRRGNGPLYLWRYEEKFGQWRGSRVLAADFAPRALTMARWKIVPTTLQEKLGEHYVE